MQHVTLRRRAAATIAAAVVTAVAFAGPAAAATVPSSGSSPYIPTQGSTVDPTAQGIIMSDGRICTPLGLLTRPLLHR